MAWALLGIAGILEIAFVRISAMVISRFGERDQYGSWCCAVREL